MHETFVDQFVNHMQTNPEQLALVCLEDTGYEHVVSRAEFLSMVMGQAVAMESKGIRAQDIVLLALPHGLELFAAFWAVLYVGAVPVINAYPSPFEDQATALDRLVKLCLEIQCSALLTLSSREDDLSARFKDSSVTLLYADLNASSTDSLHSKPATPKSLEDMAILQFSSGTTGAKKGVMISYRAINNYLAANRSSMQLTAKDCVVSWLPLNHDMGLIACFVLPLTSGLPTVLMSPRQWITQPRKLFSAVSRYRGTITLMPNFAFSFCTKNIGQEDVEKEDLSSWRLLINGAERVNLQDMKAFYERFSSLGLHRLAIRVGYGMAECVLGVSRTPAEQQPSVDWVDSKILSVEKKAVPCDSSNPESKAIVSCGRPHEMVTMEIVGESGIALQERHVGEVRIKSSTLFSGYFSPLRTEVRSADEWFYTGDLGYVFDGEIYLCGRTKDLIISYGRNVFPEDIESIAASFTEVRRGRAVAFGVTDSEKGTENIVLICEVNVDREDTSLAQLANSIRREALSLLELVISDIQFQDKGWIIKTTSGKIARSANKAKYLKKLSGV